MNTKSVCSQADSSIPFNAHTRCREGSSDRFLA